MPTTLQDARNSMDGIIDTVSAAHPVVPLLNLLKSHGKLIMVGAPATPLEVPVFPLIAGNRIAFSLELNDRTYYATSSDNA